MTGLELLAEHVERFNTGVRSGDFAAAYREQPPDDEIEVLEAAEDGDEVVARYAWLRDEGRAAGDLRLTRDGDRIARLVVTFDARA